jgi:hypothetical protein
MKLMMTIVIGMAMLAGCGGDTPPTLTDTSNPQLAGTMTAPEPLSYLLPKDLVIHAFTGKQTFDANGKPLGFEVRIKMLDGDDDPIKAYGNYSFALYLRREHSSNPRGERLDWWNEDLTNHADNQLHWDPISQTYKFNLRLKQNLPPAKQLILDAFFVSPYTNRLHAERSITITK